MPTQHTHAAAQILAGEVFGKILDREADAGGYAYVLDCLESGQKSLQQIVTEFMTSDEFIDRFITPASLAQAVHLVHKLLLGRSLNDNTQLQPALHAFVRLGLTATVENIVGSSDYGNLVGPDRVPGFGHFGPNAIEPAPEAPRNRQRRTRGSQSFRVALQEEQVNPG